MNVADFTGVLLDAGLDPAEAPAKASLLDWARAELLSLAGGDPEKALWVPGRLEIFGKHTDYAGGHSLVACVPRGFIVLGRARTDAVVNIRDAVRSEHFAVRTGERQGPEAGARQTEDDDRGVTGWRRYALTAIRRLQRNFPGTVLGADLVVASDLPPASGMSSSSALIVGIAASLVRLTGIVETAEWHSNITSPPDAAGYYACIENGMTFGALAGDAGVGTHGGSEDHVALVCGRAHAAGAWSFVPIRHVADVRMPDDWTFVIASSGVAARKTGEAKGAYNALSGHASALLGIWNRAAPPQPSLRAALTSAIDAPRQLIELVRRDSTAPRDLERRLTHFLREDARVLEAAEALRAADHVRLGALGDASQADAEQLLGNQVPETIALAASARALGAWASSSFGAGFGGSVWALVHKRDAADFAARWLVDYRERFPAREAATTFVAPPGPALTSLS